jgi:hypothetical protein
LLLLFGKISVFAPKARFRQKANAPFARSTNFLEKVAEGGAWAVVVGCRFWLDLRPDLSNRQSNNQTNKTNKTNKTNNKRQGTCTVRTNVPTSQTG